MSTSLYVVFTMDCHPAASRAALEGPKSWEQSARSIDSFCTSIANAGYAATLFLTPGCAAEHGPLMEELAGRGVELGLLVQPQSMTGAGYNRYLGQYRRDEQRAIIAEAKRQFQDALGQRPQSCRAAMYSASNDTFPVLHELGFRQGSLSSPGRRIGHHGADWTGAATDPHYVDPADRLRPGDLPFLEVPVTTDAAQVRGGLSPELALENGLFDAWHRPLIEGQLRRMAAEDVPFRALCIVTRNSFGYATGAPEKTAATLDALLTYVDNLAADYEVIPATLADLHAHYRSEMTQTQRRV